MANWYMTSFKTMDKNIVEVIKHGETIDFNYDENTGEGCCRLAWGMCSFDMKQVEEIAKEHASSFCIVSLDPMANAVQEWGFRDGVEVLANVKHDFFEWIDDGDTVRIAVNNIYNSNY